MIATSLRHLAFACTLGLALCLPAAAQEGAAPPAAAKASPPAGFVAPADPKPDDSNAQRGKSQPGNNAPFWRGVRDSGNVSGTTTVGGAESGTLIQALTEYPGSRFATAGEAWRQVRNQWILPYGGALLVIVALAIGLFYWRRGSLGGRLPDTGRLVERFSYFERAAHWSVAIAFVVLAVSGLVMAWGKFILLPVIGGTLFGWLTYALKTMHNFAGPLFAVALLILIVTFVRDNLPRREDLTWLAKAGGMLGGEEVPSHRFNAGEKVIYWVGVVALGLVVVGSGLWLDMLLPGLAYLRADMQIANMIHAIAAVLLLIVFAGHIYMGSIGVQGAYQSMRTGYVDEAWAREHHALWLDDIRAGKLAGQRSPVAAPVAVAGIAAAPRN